jgi:hypothetical protein
MSRRYILILATVLLGPPAFAETDQWGVGSDTTYNAENHDQAVIDTATQNSTGNTMADGMANDMVQHDTSSIQYTDGQAAVDSRKNAAGTAGDSAGTAAGVHAATGGIMMGTAIPMLASPIAAVRAAGAALMAKAILEFAQSAADKKNQGTNNAQRDLLTQQAGQDQQAKPDQSTAQDGLKNSKELEKELEKRGINPDDFMKQAESGQLNDTDSVLKALGENISAEDIAKGDQMAMQETENIFNGQIGELSPSTRLGYDESGASGGGGVVGGGGRGATGDLEKALAKKDGDLGPHNNFAPNVTKADLGNKNKPGAEGKPMLAMGADAMKDLLAQMLGGNAAKAQNLNLLLEAYGIQRGNPRVKMHIFQIARRNYRGWGKWRAGLRRRFALKPAQP